MPATLPHQPAGALAAKPAPPTASDLHTALEVVVRSVLDSVGYASAALSVYRPATNDFQVVVVVGSEDARRTMLDTTADAEDWESRLLPPFEHGDCYFVPEGELPDLGSMATWTPPIAPSADPAAWRAGDELTVVLRARSGRALGLLSVDEPRSGLRPTAAQLDVLGAVAFQAGMVIEAAEAAEHASAHRAALEALLSVGREIVTATSAAEIAAVACGAVRDALGFERVLVAVAEADGAFRVAAQVGREGDAIGPWDPDTIDILLGRVDADRGCGLLTLQEARSVVAPRYIGDHPSVNNGRGPHGWDRHWLIVPLVGGDGSVLGFLWPDDPTDRQIPSAERQRTLRAFANQAAAALEAQRSAGQLRYLVRHDPLTALRNRRDLTEEIDALYAEPAATPGTVLVLDADAFKRVNDELGHHAGDRALNVIADAIRAVLPARAVAARLGGEEFAVALPDGGEVAGRELAAAVRRAVVADGTVPWGLKVSVGLVARRDDEDAETLLRHASRALIAAKRLGRDRIVAYDPATIDGLLDALSRDDDRGRGQLEAVMLLAEALDLRDEGTARHSRTVGRYAEALARRTGLDCERTERVRIAGLLHDVGKLAIPDRILHKPGPLTAAEWDEVRTHPEIGARIVISAGLRDVADWVAAHHEHWDGSGYPFRLEGAAIPLEARILAVADAYEAMTASRPYRPQPLTPEAARAELRRCAGTQFDPDVVEAFLRLLD